jgi:hypothetical protein
MDDRLMRVSFNTLGVTKPRAEPVGIASPTRIKICTVLQGRCHRNRAQGTTVLCGMLPRQIRLGFDPSSRPEQPKEPRRGVDTERATRLPRPRCSLAADVDHIPLERRCASSAPASMLATPAWAIPLPRSRITMARSLLMRERRLPGTRKRTGQLHGRAFRCFVALQPFADQRGDSVALAYRPVTAGRSLIFHPASIPLGGRHVPGINRLPVRKQEECEATALTRSVRLSPRRDRVLGLRFPFSAPRHLTANH